MQRALVAVALVAVAVVVVLLYPTSPVAMGPR
jgi:hypothetical protein